MLGQTLQRVGEVWIHHGCRSTEGLLAVQITGGQRLYKKKSFCTVNQSIEPKKTEYSVLHIMVKAVLRIWNTDPVLFWLLDPGWKKSRSRIRESGINIPDHISVSLFKKKFRVKKCLKFLVNSVLRIRCLFAPGSGAEKSGWSAPR